jgi:hypothetical protein
VKQASGRKGAVVAGGLMRMPGPDEQVKPGRES